MGKVAANAMSRQKGNDSKLPSCFTVPPQTIRLTAYCQLPRKRWRLLVPYKLKHLACPERGGVNERQRVDGGVAAWLLLFTSTPQSGLRLASSPFGEPFCAPYTLSRSPCRKAGFHTPLGVFHMAQPYFTLRQQYFTARKRNSTARQCSILGTGSSSLCFTITHSATGSVNRLTRFTRFSLCSSGSICR